MSPLFYAIKRLPAIESENDYLQILQNLQLIENGELKRAAIVLFGKEPRKFFGSVNF